MYFSLIVSLLALSVLYAPALHAAESGHAHVSCTVPTERVDGTPYTNPGGLKFYWGSTMGGPYPNSIDQPDPTDCSMLIPDLDEGQWYFVVTAYDDAQLESAYSNEVTKIIRVPPAAPSMLEVSNLTVFTVSKQTDKFVLFAVGTVPAGTACDPTQSVNGRYVVPIADVTLTGTVDPVVVVADCS